MKFLLFILGISFFFIFYFFYWSENIQESLFKNIFLEANLYVIFSIFCILYIWKQEWQTQKEEMNDWEIPISRDFKLNISFTKLSKIFFEKYIYILGIILFYLSTSLFLHVFFEDISLSWIFLFFNLLVGTLYFLEEKFQVFQDFLRVNTSVISLYYIFFHIAYLLGIVEVFSLVDMVNIAITWLLFYIFLNSSRQRKYIPEFYTYILVFFFLELLVLLKFLLWETYIGAVLISSVLAWWFLIYTSEISKFLHLNKKYIRIWGLCSSYIYIILVWRYVIETWYISLLFLVITLLISTLLFLFHRKFENYISLFFASYGFLVAAFISYSSLFSGTIFYTYAWIFMILLSFGYILWSTFSSRKYIHDRYFFHIFSLVVNILWCILFVLYYDMSILSLSILLMVESIYFFYSYYTLPKNTH